MGRYVVQIALDCTSSVEAVWANEHSASLIGIARAVAATCILTPRFRLMTLSAAAASPMRLEIVFLSLQKDYPITCEDHVNKFPFV